MREQILALASQMGREFPGFSYSDARQHFGLLPRVKALRPGCFATAKEVWESCGLLRADLVAAFEAAGRLAAPRDERGDCDPRWPGKSVR